MAGATQTRTPYPQFFHHIFNASPVGITVENLDGQPLFVNPAFCSFLGFSEKELRNKHCVDFSPREDAEKDWALFQQLRAGSIDHYQLEKRYFRKDGSLVWGLLSISLLDSHPSPLVIAMVEDISEKKRAQNDLELITKEMAAAVTRCSRDFRYLWANQAYAEWLQRPLNEIVDRSILDVVGKEAFEALLPHFNRVLTGEKVHYEQETTFLGIGKRWISSTYTPTHDASGAVDGWVAVVLDTTERKLADEAVHKSEERFRLAALAGRMFAYEWDVATDVITRSRDVAQILGSDEPLETTGQRILARIHPDDREGVTAAVAVLSPENPHLQISYRMARSDGTFIWVERTSRAHFKQGKMLRLVGMVADFTERKQAEEALRVSEERLRLAQKVARIGSFERNIRTGVNTWTAEMESMYGLPPGGFGQTRTAFENLVHPDDRAKVIELVDYALKSRLPTEGEWRVIWPDGSVHWIAGRWQVLVDESGETSRVVGVNMDVSQRKLAEQELRESEQRLRLATQAGRMYAYDWDVGKDAVLRSSEHIKILGLTEALRFPQQQFVDKIHPDDRPKFLAAIAGLTPENPTGEVTYRALAPDGTLVWLKSNGRGFFDAEGRILRVIGMVADVTDQKRTEEALSEMSRQLMAAQEQERFRIARELHDDINQRLAMLAVQLKQLQEHPSEIESRVQNLRKQAAEISNGVHALSHDLHFSPLEYLGLVAGMKSWCKEFGERQGMQIDCRHDMRTTLPPEIGLCLFRVLQEALHNAAKHSGVKRIDAQLHEESDEIHLIVRDSGRGFDVRAVKQGNGLGLSSMRERVRLVGGTITIESKPMGGTTIHVRVPFRSK